jgi:hypothetical protein
MGQGRFCLLFAMAVSLATAFTFAGSAAAKPSCASRLIADWRDGGRIDGTYPVSCYRQALAQLPEDVRVYSSAQSDITRALQSRLSTRSLQTVDSATNKDDRAGVSPLLVVAITAAILVAAGSVAAALR